MLLKNLQEKYSMMNKFKVKRLKLTFLLVALFSVFSFFCINYFNANYIFGLNLTKSLPGTIFIINKGEKPHVGDFVGFSFEGYKGYYAAGTVFVKIMAGDVGDEAHVTFNDCLEYKVNDVSYGCIKEETSKGDHLNIGSVGIIPPHYYAVRGTHPDSFDSRYAEVGWINDSRTLGKAYRLF